MEKILEFYTLINKLKKVKRQHYVIDSWQRERTPEHSYSTAMLAWYICEKENLNLDKEKLFKYALAHDLVEAYAGDVSRFEQDKDKKEKKHEREKEAMLKIEDNFNDFTDLHKSIAEYEKRDTAEAKFIYAVDGLESEINAYLDNHKVWKKLGITKDKVIDKTRKKFSSHPVIEKYFLELMEKIKD